jgi:hypothetical protein
MNSTTPYVALFGTEEVTQDRQQQKVDHVTECGGLFCVVLRMTLIADYKVLVCINRQPTGLAGLKLHVLQDQASPPILWCRPSLTDFCCSVIEALEAKYVSRI